MVVSMTGYRPEKMPFREGDTAYLLFHDTLREVMTELIGNGATDFISGVARGFDLWAAEEVLHLRNKNPNVKLQCAIPFLKQADSWDEKDKERYKSVLSAADRCVLISEKYRRDCFFARNRYMVDRADIVLCAFNGLGGGTAYTVKYALKSERAVIQIDPSDCGITMLGRPLPNFHSI